MKKVGYILVSKEKLSKNEPVMFSVSKKKCTKHCSGDCECDPRTYYYQVFYYKSEALKHKDLLTKVMKVVINSLDIDKKKAN